MSNAWTLIFAFCITIVVTEGRYIPTRTYRVQNGPLFHSSRRISNPANTQLYGNILQRHGNQFRRHPTSFRATRVQNGSTRRNLQTPERHSTFDSIVRQAVRKVSESRDFHHKDNIDTVKMPTSVSNNAEKRLNINVNSVNDKDNLGRRKINAKNFRKLRISHKDANIVINRLASHVKVQNSRSPFSKDHTARSSETLTSIRQKSRDALRTSHNFKHNKNNGPSLLKLNKKYDSVTLPSAAWYMVTSKPKTNILTPSKKPSIDSSQPTTEKHEVAVTLTSHKIASSPVTPTALPVTVATEEIDLPDLPDTTEIPDKNESAFD